MFSPALPVKDALRGLRAGLNASRQAIQPLRDNLPPPVSHLLGDLLRQVDRVGMRVEHEASRLVHSILDQSATSDRHAWTLTRMTTDPAGPDAFAERLYAGLQVAFARMSLPHELPSEVLAARVFEQALHLHPDDIHELAATLFLQLDSGVFAPPPPFSARASAPDRRLALFAVMLWLLADPDTESDEKTLLGICIDAASAIGRQFADLPHSHAAVRQLLSDYVRLI